jgi:hypothetical protein
MPKEKQITAIHINAKEKIVDLVTLDNTLPAIYDVLELPRDGWGPMIEAIYPFEQEDCIYLDENGEDNKWEVGFRIGEWTILGNGLVVGTDNKGNTIGATVALEEVRRRVRFVRFDRRF